jgi:hypothetical protein
LKPLPSTARRCALLPTVTMREGMKNGMIFPGMFDSQVRGLSLFGQPQAFSVPGLDH